MTRTHHQQRYRVPRLGGSIAAAGPITEDSPAALRSGSERAEKLWRYLTSIAGTTKIGVVLTPEISTAHCTPHPNGDGWVVRITTSGLPQPATDLEQTRFDYETQLGLGLHETGHILYTDFAAYTQSKAAVVDEHSDSVQSFVDSLFNIFEDGVCEQSLREDFSESAAGRLHTVNLNLCRHRLESTDPVLRQNMTVDRAIKAAATDIAVADSTITERLRDTDIEEWQFASDTHERAFEALFPTIRDTHVKTLTAPDPATRYQYMADCARIVLDVITTDDTSPNSQTLTQPDGKPAQSSSDSTPSSSGGPDGKSASDDATEPDGDGQRPDSASEPRSAEATSDSNSGDGTGDTGEADAADSGDVDTGAETGSADNGTSSGDAGADNLPDGDELETPVATNDGTDADETAFGSPHPSPEEADADGQTASNASSTADVDASVDTRDVSQDPDISPSEAATQQEAVSGVRSSDSAPVPSGEQNTSAGTGTDGPQSESEADQSPSSQPKASGISDETGDPDQPDADDSGTDTGSATEQNSEDAATSGPTADSDSDGADTDSAAETQNQPAPEECEQPSLSQFGTNPGSSDDENIDDGSEGETPASSDTESNTPDPDESVSENGSAPEEESKAGPRDTTPSHNGESTTSEEDEAEDRTPSGSDSPTGEQTEPSNGADTASDQSSADETPAASSRPDIGENTPTTPEEIPGLSESKPSQISQEQQTAKREQRRKKRAKDQLNNKLDGLSDDIIILPDADSQFDANRWGTAIENGKVLANIFSNTLEESRFGDTKRGTSFGSRVDSRLVYRVANNDPRVFSAHRRGDDKRYRFVLILDRSASMSSTGEDGGPVGRAEEATIQIAKALDELTVDVAIIDFIHGQPRVVKPFGFPIESCPNRLATANSGGGTPLGHALEVARDLLDNEQGSDPGHIVAMTDDNPTDPGKYHSVFDDCQYPVHGVLIDMPGSGTPDRNRAADLYDDTICIETKAELCDRVLTLARTLTVRQ